VTRLGRVSAFVVAALVVAVAVVLVVIQLGGLTGGAVAGEPTGSAGNTTNSTVDITASDTALGAPTRVTIPAIGVDASLVAVGLNPDASMQTPDFGHAAWYQPGPKPGEVGPAVVVAHVDSKAHGPDVFYRLHELKPGDRVTVHYTDTERTFEVTGREQTKKSALPTDRIWNTTGEPVLRLITCGGAFDSAARSYLDNIIVYADRLV